MTCKIFNNLDGRSQASVIMPQEEPGAFHVPHLSLWTVGAGDRVLRGAQVLVGGIQELEQ